MARLSEMFRASRDCGWDVSSTRQIEALDPPVILYSWGQIPLPFSAEVELEPALTSVSPSEQTTAQKIVRAKTALKRLLEAGSPLAAAFSGGKDSSVMLSLLLTSAVEYKEAGGTLPPILVTHANTGIENPAYQVVVHHELARVREFALANGLPVRIDIATPMMNDTWAVRIISGRALPTFANSSSRDCSVIWKIRPQERQRKLALRELQASGEPVVLVGTRFDESETRAARMRDRGETDEGIWQQDIRDKTGRLIRSENRMSPLANWTDEDIWVYMSQLRNGTTISYSDGEEVWNAYADGGGGGGCAVIGDDAMKSSAKACGARFGCALCTAVGRDKSLEAMIEADEKYHYLINLNRLQRFLVNTQHDWSLRNWLGRTIDKDGFIAIEPDTYSAEMAASLLAMSLTIDLEERETADRLGIAPRFQLISASQLLAIDAVWSLQAYQERSFSAIAIWNAVVNDGKRVYPPKETEKVKPEKKPQTRYLFVGDYDDSHAGSLPFFGGGGLIDATAIAAGVAEARDQSMERARLSIRDKRSRGEKITLKEEERIYSEALASAGGCIGVRHLEDGRMVVDVRASDMFDIDEEAAHLFLQFEAKRMLEQHHQDPACSPTRAYLYYAQLGILGTTPQHLSTIDEMMRRSNWKIRHGLHRMSRDELITKSLSKADRTAGLKAPAGEKTLHEIYLESPLVQTERRFSALQRKCSSGPKSVRSDKACVI